MEAVRAQERLDTTSFCIMAYNVENLFDCRHDTLKDDYEFLPGGIRHWTYSRYKQKLDNVARVITAVGGWNPPALVALCEVENDRVLRDLTRYSALREHGYRYILTHSEDRRGIDVAVLYRRDLFKPLQWQSLRVERKWAFIGLGYAGCVDSPFPFSCRQDSPEGSLSAGSSPSGPGYGR